MPPDWKSGVRLQLHHTRDYFIRLLFFVGSKGVEPSQTFRFLDPKSSASQPVAPQPQPKLLYFIINLQKELCIEESIRFERMVPF